MDYNEELGKILANAELDETGKASAIAKLTGECFVSKSNHNKALTKVQTELDNTKTELGTTKGELDTLKNSQLTDDQKKQKELDDIANTKRDLAIERSQIQAEKILSKVVADDKELESLVKGISSEDMEATKTLAQELVNTITKQKEATEAKIREELINDTPKPKGGEQDKPMTKEAFLKLGYNEQVKYKIENPEGYKQLFN